MSIVYPANRQIVVDRILSDIQNEIPELLPLLRTSLIRALGVANAGRFFDIYKQIEQLQNELFPQTATTFDFLRQIGLLKGVDVNPASSSVGFITATGLSGNIISQGDLYTTENDFDYEVINQNYTLQTQVLNVTSITRSGSTATATFNVAHKIATNTDVTFAGAVEPEYNGTFTVTAISETQLTYPVSGTPGTPAGGTITATLTFTSIEVRSVDTGQNKNLDSGAKLTLKTPIIGVDDDAYVQFTKIAGGEDEEDIESYRARVLDTYANPIATMNDATIIKLAKSISGITRVWAFDATPIAGEFEVYHTRDNDDDPIPTPAELDILKDELLKLKYPPMRDQDVHVLPPTKINVDFVFTDLQPDSQLLRDEIEKNLVQFFKEIPNVSQNVAEDGYRSVIWQTLNPETGQFVESFVLSNPTGDIAIASGQLALLGTITWNF